MAKRGRPPKTGQRLAPSEIVLAGVVARRYYLEERSKVQIAEELGLSRFQVTRILGRARAEGWIKIQIDLPGHIDDALSVAVQRDLGVRRAIVVDAPGLRCRRTGGTRRRGRRRARRTGAARSGTRLDVEPDDRGDGPPVTRAAALHSHPAGRLGHGAGRDVRHGRDRPLGGGAVRWRGATDLRPPRGRGRRHRRGATPPTRDSPGARPGKQPGRGRGVGGLVGTGRLDGVARRIRTGT